MPKLSRKTKPRRSKRNSAANLHPSYQSLEPRRLLATFTVDTISLIADGTTDGSISLGEAIQAANTNLPFGDASAGDATGDRIHFDASLDGEVITLETQLAITDDLVIQGFKNSITISGNDQTRIFEIATSEDVVIANVNLIDGRANEGGALLTRGGGKIRLYRVDFDGNYATNEDSGGGAIFNLNSRIFSSQLTLTNNFSYGSGGAILSANGQIFLDQSTATTNKADRNGGVIAVVKGGYFFSQSQFHNNEAKRDFSLPAVNSSGFSYGAALERPYIGNSGGAISFEGSSAVSVMTNVTFTGNDVYNNGGAIAIETGNKVYIYGESTFSNNAARYAIFSSVGGGGAIFSDNAVLAMGGTKFDGNVATGGSGGAILAKGGILRIFNSRFDGNGAMLDGGGVASRNGYANVHSSTFVNNLAGSLPNGFNGNGISHQPHRGGGIFIGGGDSSLASIVSSTFRSNESVQDGGAVYNSGRLLVAGDTLIAGNTALARDNGFVYGGGGGIFNNGPSLEVYSTNIENNFARGEWATGGGVMIESGHVKFGFSMIQNNGSGSSGGGFAIFGGATSIYDSNTSNNSANQVPGNLIAAGGGGIYLSSRFGTPTSASLSVLGGFVTHNSTTGINGKLGGGIYAGRGSQVLLGSFPGSAGVSVSNNRATDAGGGIHSESAALIIRDAEFSNNSARLGGGISLIDGSASISDSSIVNNSATDQGGGIYQDSVVIARVNTNVTDNQAPIDPNIASV